MRKYKTYKNISFDKECFYFTFSCFLCDITGKVKKLEMFTRVQAVSIKDFKDTLKKLLSTSDNYKKLSVLAQVLNFFTKNTCRIQTFEPYLSSFTRVLVLWEEKARSPLILNLSPRGITLMQKGVRDFFRTKGFLRIFDGFFLKQRDFCQRCTRFLWVKCPSFEPLF